MSFCDTINMCTINLFVFRNLVRRVSWLSNKEEGTPFFISKKQQALGTRLCISLQHKNWITVTNTSFTFNEKIKRRWAKKAKKTKKKLRLHWNYHWSTFPVNSYNIILSTRIDRGEGAVRMRFHGAASLLTVDCVGQSRLNSQW